MADDRKEWYSRRQDDDDRRRVRSRSIVVYRAQDDLDDRDHATQEQRRSYYELSPQPRQDQLIVRGSRDSRAVSQDRRDHDGRDQRRRDYKDDELVVYQERRVERYSQRGNGSSRDRSRRRGGPSSRGSYSDDDYSDDDRFQDKKDKSRRKKQEASGRLWYSQKERKDANFVERNFDSSYDGLISALAGAALGSLTANRFCEGEHKKKKVIAATLAGAATFNIAENWYRVYTEEEPLTERVKDKVRHEARKVREEVREDVHEVKKALRV